LIGVFLCSWTYAVFAAAKESNRRVEEAFRTLEGAVEESRRKKQGARSKKQGKKGKRWGTGKGGKGNRAIESSGHRVIE